MLPVALLAVGLLWYLVEKNRATTTVTAGATDTSNTRA